MTKRYLFPFAICGLSWIFGGCGLVLGLDDYAKGASTSTGDAGQGGSGGANTGGAAGTGGTNSCEPGTMQNCYTGAPETRDVGACKSGMETCLSDGKGYGACEGQVLPAAEDCSQVGDEDCDGSACSETNWARIFGDSVEQTAQVIASDGQGGVYFAGSMDGTVKFDNTTLVTGGGRDIFLARLGSDGKVLWAKRFGTAANQDPAAIAIDTAGNVYLGANIAGVVDFGGGPLPFGGYTDIAIASFDAQGNHRWSHSYGDNAAQEIHGLAVSPTGELVAVGSFGGSFNMGKTALTSAGDWDVYVAKLELATGDEIWNKRFGATTMEQSDAVAVDSSGGILVGGRYGGAVGFGGASLPIGMNDINVFVLKLDTAGTHVWSKGFGDDNISQSMRSVGVDQDGAVIVGGDFEGSMNFGGAILTTMPGARDIFVAKFSSTGAFVWSKKFGGNGDDMWPRLAVDPAGNVFLSCYFTNSIDFGGSTLLSDGSFDFAVARLGSDGSHVWSRRFGGMMGDLTQQKNADTAWSPGALFVAASQVGSTDYGKGTLTSAGSFDAAIVSIGP